jgi:hypothetical protein
MRRHTPQCDGQGKIARIDALITTSRGKFKSFGNASCLSVIMRHLLRVFNSFERNMRALSVHASTGPAGANMFFEQYPP